MVSTRIFPMGKERKNDKEPERALQKKYKKLLTSKKKYVIIIMTIERNNCHSYIYLKQTFVCFVSYLQKRPTRGLFKLSIKIEKTKKSSKIR